MSDVTRQRWTFRAQVDEQGKLHPEQATTVRARLARWAKRSVYITVSLEHKRRSTTANAYLWFVYGVISDWCGHDDEEIHEYLKTRFCPGTERVLPTGEVMAVRTTKTLDSAAFGEYVSKVKQWAAEQGLYIPEPGEMEQPL